MLTLPRKVLYVPLNCWTTYEKDSPLARVNVEKERMTMTMTKTMNNSKDYTNEIEQARANLEDAHKRGEDAIGGNALELLQGLLTPEELPAIGE